MFTAPPARNTGLFSLAPVLAICCLLLALLLIASVIVLSLIPVYTHRQTATPQFTNLYFSITVNYNPGNNSSLPNGPLDASNLYAFARALEAKSGLTTGSITAVNGVVTTVSGKRKRRSFELTRLSREKRQVVVQVIVFTILVDVRTCQRCRNPSYVVEKITLIVVVVDFFFNGLLFVLTFIIASITRIASIPSTTIAATTTTTAAVTANG